MKQLTRILFSLLLTAGGVRALAQDTNSAGGLDLKSFDIIVQNNIFDQSRTGLSGVGRPRVHVARIQRLSLLGVSGDNGKGDIFFGGNGAPSDPVKVGDHVDGFVVSNATMDSVCLANPSNSFVLEVEHSLRRVDDGPWEKSSDESEPAPVATNGSDDSSATSSPAAADAAHPGEDAITRKLRLRREQEEK